MRIQWWDLHTIPVLLKYRKWYSDIIQMEKAKTGFEYNEEKEPSCGRGWGGGEIQI